MHKNIMKNISIAMLVTLLVSLFSFVQIPQFKLQEAKAACTNINASFPDAKFMYCVSKSMGEDGTQVCLEGIAGLTDLGSANCMSGGDIASTDEIEDITGMELLTSLQTVNLIANNITDLTPITGLTSIYELYLVNNSIEDITPLGTLTGLQDLYISNASVFPSGFIYRNNITSLDALSLLNLYKLYADGNNISDISGVESMTNLTWLSLTNNNIDDTALNGVDWSTLTSLDILALSNEYYPFDSVNTNSITDITPLDGLGTNNTITTLMLSNNNISDLSTVNWGNLTNLTRLNLHKNNIGDLSPLVSGGASFASGNTISLKGNEELSTETTHAAARTAVTTMIGFGATAVTEDISWEDCGDALDNDGDGLKDSADSYCYPNIAYINYDLRTVGIFPSAHAIGGICGQESTTPCKDFTSLLAEKWYQDMFKNPPYEDITVYIKGASATSLEDVIIASGEDMRNAAPTGTGDTLYTSTSLNIEPWPGETNISIASPVIVLGDNITMQGFEIKNFSDNFGLGLLGVKNSTFKNNYIHDNGMGIVMLATENVTIANNILSGNTGTLRTEDLNTLLTTIDSIFGFDITVPSITVPACAGIAVAAAKNAKIINNSLYNNCDDFVFVNDPGNPANSEIKLGDLTVISIDFLPISKPVNTIVKQNIVYNELPPGPNPPRTYYYNTGGENVNDLAVIGEIYDANAAGHGSGNNFAETLTDPYISAATVTNYASAGTGFVLNDPATYQTCTIAAETPTEDFLGNARPDGPVEAGALEVSGGSCGGGGWSPTIPVACAIPSPIDLPKELPITPDEEGDPTVELNWSKSKISIEDFDTDTKIEILLKYLEKNPTITINGNTKDLKSGFARYIFSSISKSISPTLKGSFEKNLHSYADREIGVIRDMLKSIGIQEIFSDWWPYFAIETLKNNANAEKIFTEALKESLYIITRNLNILREQSKEAIPVLSIWSDFMTAFTKTLASRLVKEADVSDSAQFNSAVKCISNATRTTLRYSENKSYNPFVAHAISYYSPFEKEVANFFEKISAERKRQFDNALEDVIKEETLKPIIESILFDSQLIKNTQQTLDIGFTELLNIWKKHAGIMNLADFYQTNEKFLIYKNLLFGTGYFIQIENCIESNYKNDLISMLKKVRYNVIYNMLGQNNDYNDNETKLMMDILTKIRNDSTAKEAIDPLIIKFISYLSSVSEKDDNETMDADIKRILEKEITIEISPDFNEYYKKEAGVTRVEIIEGITTDIYRGILYRGSSSDYRVKDTKKIATIDDPNITKYLDETRSNEEIERMATIGTKIYDKGGIPDNKSNKVIDYGYYIVANTNCASATGSIAKASINPVIPDGIPIPNVFLNLKIQNKKGMSQRLMELLQELLESAPMQIAALTTQVTAQATSTLQIQQKMIQQLAPQPINQGVCFRSKVKLLGEKLTGDTIFNYLVDCVAFNQTIRYKIIQQRENIIPPLFLTLKNVNSSQFEARISNFMAEKLENIIDQIEAEEYAYAQEGIQNLIPLTTTILAKNSLDDFSEDEKMLIKCLGVPECTDETMQMTENLFKGASHATDVVIEKYDKNNDLMETFTAHVDIFGEANKIPIGQFISGEKYKLKIKLAYINKITGKTQYIKYVLPKITPVLLRNAKVTPEGLVANLTLNLRRPFQYGNFFDSDDVIDIKDFKNWGLIFTNKLEEWEYGNLDGHPGINIGDALTFHENWGKIQEMEIKEEEGVTLADLASVLGFSFP